MSSTSALYGFRPAFSPSGVIRAKAYTIASTYATSIYSGDPVKLVADGVVEQAAAGDTMLGVFAGVEYTDSTGARKISPYWPASTTATNITCYVYDDPETVFETQFTNPSSGTSIQTSIGAMGDHALGTGSTYTGLSGAGITTLGQAGWQLVGISGRVTDAITDAYVNVLVRINEHHYKYPTTAV